MWQWNSVFQVYLFGMLIADVFTSWLFKYLRVSNLELTIKIPTIKFYTFYVVNSANRSRPNLDAQFNIEGDFQLAN